MRLIAHTDEHVLEARDGGYIVAWFPIAVGAEDTPTPPGVWTLALGSLPEDNSVIATLSTPGTCCLRKTENLASIGTHASGG